MADVKYRGYEVVEGQINGKPGFNVFMGFTWVGGKLTLPEAKKIADQDADRRIAQIQKKINQTSDKNEIQKLQDRIRVLSKSLSGWKRLTTSDKKALTRN